MLNIEHYYKERNSQDKYNVPKLLLEIQNQKDEIKRLKGNQKPENQEELYRELKNCQDQMKDLNKKVRQSFGLKKDFDALNVSAGKSNYTFPKTEVGHVQETKPLENPYFMTIQ